MFHKFTALIGIELFQIAVDGELRLFSKQQIPVVVWLFFYLIPIKINFKLRLICEQAEPLADRKFHIDLIPIHKISIFRKLRQQTGFFLRR